MPAPPPENPLSARPGGLHGGFLRSAERFADRPALEVERQAMSYGELRDHAARIAATLQAELPEGGDELVAIYAYRSVPAFTGVLGVLMAGRAYVPLNPRLARERNRLMLERAGCSAIVADAQSAANLADVLAGEDGLTIIVPDLKDSGPLAEQLAGHRVLGASELAAAEAWRTPDLDPSHPAYVLFTSGSTGTPKGVTVRHENVIWLLDTMCERFELDQHDRISQSHEFTFDVSVWDMFVTWEVGACLCCPSQKELISPGRYIRESELTVWFAVPSTSVLMRRLGQLKEGSYPTLRYVLFAGEALPLTMVEAWQAVAPGAVFENLYGPVELTIVCTGYRWSADSPGECEAGVVPIGGPLRGNEVLVVDSSLQEVEPGETGELVITGPQVTSGYWRDPERTAAAFLDLPGRSGTYYRTGDHVRRATADRPMTYLGRLDHQIKVRGVRVELGEVEAVLREETDNEAVVAVGWPVTATGADGIVAFVGGAQFDRRELMSRLRARLLPQMVPREVRHLPELPLNGNGKFDRVALAASLEADERAVA